MPFQASETLDDQLILDGTNGFSTGVISATRPDSIPATSMESAINMDYDDFGNIVSRLGTVTLAGNPLVQNWEDIVDNWNAITSSFGSNLQSTPASSQASTSTPQRPNASSSQSTTPPPRRSTTDRREPPTPRSQAPQSIRLQPTSTSRSSTRNCSTETATAASDTSRRPTSIHRSQPARSAASMSSTKEVIYQEFQQLRSLLLQAGSRPRVKQSLQTMAIWLPSTSPIQEADTQRLLR